jgi:hypothetical protein
MLVRDGTCIPKIVRELIVAIETEEVLSSELFKGMKTYGIYRVSCSSNELKKCITALDATMDAVSMLDLTCDVATIAGTLKRFFRDLPDSLIPRKAGQMFIDASSISPYLLSNFKTAMTV